MSWLRTRPPVPAQHAPCTAPGENHRMAVLQASWARDRQVARRRLALRWLQWALLRYLLPLVLVALASMVVWVWLLPQVQAGIAHFPANLMAAQTPLASPQPAPHTPAAPLQTLTSIAWSPTTAPEEASLPLALRFHSTLEIPRQAATNQTTAHEPNPLHTLKPENWLHSKEP